MRNGRLIQVAIMIALSGVLSFAFSYQRGQTPTTVQPRALRSVDRFPGFRLPNLSGEMVSFDQFRGKVVLVDLWATWCPPCEKQVPWFEEFYRSFRKQGFEVVGIALDSDPETVGQFVTKHGITYSILLHPDLMENPDEQAKWDVRGIPTTFILNRKGMIVHKVVGFEDKAVFEEVLSQMF